MLTNSSISGGMWERSHGNSIELTIISLLKDRYTANLFQFQDSRRLKINQNHILGGIINVISISKWQFVYQINDKSIH